MSEAFKSRIRITSSFEQLRANRDYLRRNVLDSVRQAFATAEVLEVDGLPDDPTAEAAAAFAKLDATMQVVLDRILAKLESLDG